jgi:gamma-glutamyltranspeptidase/glutathione hydrolase
MSQVTRDLDATDAPATASHRDGMVVTSHPRAVEAGIAALREGGTAVDAAVRAAAVLGVVDPMSTGIGGDCFALVWDPATGLAGINGSGRAPRAASLDALADLGHKKMPEDGILSVTVPGALHAWDALVTRFGRLPIADHLRAAATVARDGFVVTPVVARDWRAAESRLRRGAGADAWLTGGRAPEAGQTFRERELAAALEQIASEGVQAFYGGAIGRAIAATSAALGGWLALEDLAEHESEWVDPIEGSYRGYPVFELPPNGQGLVVLEALGLLEEWPLADLAPEHRMHLAIEAVKVAFADARAHLGDPAFMDRTPESFLDPEFLDLRRHAMGERAAAVPVPVPFGSDTVYVAAVDAEGRACSLINSLYMHFGAAVVVPGTGITLQNRGALFSTDPSHPAALGSRRRPYHTIIPAMAFREGAPWLVFGVVGGFQQPQAQVQLLLSLIDEGLELGDAVAAPRFRWVDGVNVRLEEGIHPRVARALAHRGHEIIELDAHGGFGGAQAIAIDRATAGLTGASDPRKDGLVGRVTLPRP